MNDPKELLSRAFGEEPPLRIDRDQVIQQGRKRLRRRRFFEAGGVVAAVLVAAVGAATLTNLSGSEPGTLPPAAVSTRSPAETPTPVSPPPTVATPSPGAPSIPPPARPLNTNRLLKLLYEPGIVTAEDVQAVLGTSGDPRFELSGDEYVYEADVVRPKTPGSLYVMVTNVSGQGVDCVQVPPPYGDCGTKLLDGVPVLVSRFESPSGQRGFYAAAELDNGVRVVGTTTNLTSYDPRSVPADRAPALTQDELCDLVLTVGGNAS
jgi:hypothetical protein